MSSENVSAKVDLSPGKYRERLHQILSKARASQEQQQQQVYSPRKYTPSPIQERTGRHTRTVSVDVSSAGLPRPSSRRLSFEKSSPSFPTEDTAQTPTSQNDEQKDDKISRKLFQRYHHSRSQSLAANVTSGASNIATTNNSAQVHSKQRSSSRSSLNNEMPCIDEENIAKEEDDEWSPMKELPQLLEQLEKTPRTCRKNSQHHLPEQVSLPPTTTTTTTPISNENTMPTTTMATTALKSAKETRHKKRTSKKHYPQLPLWFQDNFRDTTTHDNKMQRNEKQPSPPPILHAGLPTAAMEFLISEDLLYALLGISGRMTSYLECIRCSEQEHVTSSNPAINLGCRILPLAHDLTRVQTFIDQVSYESGLVKQATCGILKSLLDEYYRRIVSMEGLLRRGELSLQTLWLSLQPCFRTMAVLRRIVDALDNEDIRGSLALGTLHSIALQLLGDPDAHEVAKNIMRVAFQPMIEFLSLWLNSGVIYDPFEEFFITEQEKYKEWEPGQVLDDSFWELRFVLRKSQVPSFFRGTASKILTCGKYKCVMKSLFSESSAYSSATSFPIALEEWTPEEDILDRILSRIENAFVYSSKELYHILCDRFQLLPFLGFLKHYFLLSQADFLGFFLDFADEELSKPIATISTESLFALLELSIRSCCSNYSESDVQKDSLFCRLMPQSLTSQLLRIIHLNDMDELTISDKDELHNKDIFGYEAFCLDCHIPFPLSIIISKRMLTKYQLLFRHLFACKVVHRKLEQVWILLKTQRGSFRHKWISDSCILFHRMIHFVDSVLYYDFMEVIQPNFKAMEISLKTECDKLEVASRKHNDFLDTILKQCMLTNPKLLRTQSKLLNACIMFSNWIQENTNIPPSTTSSSFQWQREAEETILKIGNYFLSHLQVLTESLSAFSLVDAEPHLANLCTRLNFNNFLLHQHVPYESSILEEVF